MRAKLQVNFDPGQDLVFLLCENKAKVIRRPCDSTSGNLIDLCITISPEKVTNSGVIHLGISDHSLVCILIPMKCGVYGKKCFLAASINTHHLNPQEFEKNDLRGLLESY